MLNSIVGASGEFRFWGFGSVSRRALKPPPKEKRRQVPGPITRDANSRGLRGPCDQGRFVSLLSATRMRAKPRNCTFVNVYVGGSCGPTLSSCYLGLCLRPGLCLKRRHDILASYDDAVTEFDH